MEIGGLYDEIIGKNELEVWPKLMISCNSHCYWPIPLQRKKYKRSIIRDREFQSLKQILGGKAPLFQQ